ncbi:hypothetical protein C7212DRAFT_327215 [Tuber magnatum]|uniref:Uncharacterized protein n=1 Tax=Tuber magnatum TaxID=42249 RepID=A0A317SJ10_9PEZI|nr:hypothetical protein C7212DRAFT_327215 [Tuber magnatum]
MQNISEPIESAAFIPYGCQVSIIELLNLNIVAAKSEPTLWASEYKIAADIFPDILPLIKQKISSHSRIRMENYPNDNKVVLSIRGYESFGFDIPEALHKFLFRRDDPNGFKETTIVKRASPINIISDTVIPDSAIYMNASLLPCMVVDVVNDNNTSAFHPKFCSYIAGKGQIRFSIVLSTKNIDPYKSLKETRSIGKVYISAYELTETGVQTVLLKTEIWPCVPKEELILDGIWEVHTHIPLKILHDKVCQALGNTNGTVARTARKAVEFVRKSLHLSSKEEEEDTEEQPEWPLKDRCTEVNLGRRVTTWRKPSTNPPNLVIEHQH